MAYRMDRGTYALTYGPSTGDRIRLASPGGGGFGDPAARPPAAIEEDLNNGLVTASNASGIYAASVTRSGELAGRPLYRVAR